jgi:YesN/AraC family two-component response regulator
VRQADNGRKAIECIVAEGVPELLIVDIFMPDMDGIETITHLKEKRVNCPILAISGGGMSKNLSYLGYARSLGADKTLEKPISRDMLLSTVSALLS